MKLRTVALAALTAMPAMGVVAAEKGLSVSLEKPLASGHLSFDGNIRRFELELDKPMDLSDAAGVTFDIKCADPAVLSNCWLLFKTGDGYYRARVEIPSAPSTWTRRTVLKSEVRLYHWETHISLLELYARPNPDDLPDWSRVKAFEVVFSLAIDRTSPDASVFVRDFAPLAEQSPECAAAREAAARFNAETCRRACAIPPRKGERRYLATHVWGLDSDWDVTCRRLKALGITDVIPLMTYAGQAYYRSRLEPSAPMVDAKGDALKACLAACRKHGIGCYPWRSCWELTKATSQTALARFAAENRLQVSFDGKASEWFCPTHPENVRREIEGIVELSEAGADGILLDYFRYPNSDYCFCPRCRAKFEASLGHAVKNWPGDVRTDAELAEKWNKFRMGVLTDVLRNIRREVGRNAPGMKLTSAVAATVKNAEARGQDWPEWCREGLLDTLFTMCYYSTSKMLERSVKAQMEVLRGTKTTLCPMICFACGGIPFNEPDEVARQIQVVRDAGLPELSFFRLQEYAPTVLEILRKGPLSDD